MNSTLQAKVLSHFRDRRTGFVTLKNSQSEKIVLTFFKVVRLLYDKYNATAGYVERRP